MRSLSDLLYNFHWIVPGEAARAAQAYAGFLQPYLEARGIKSLINLRGRNDDLSWWKYETRCTEAAGAVHFDAMLDSRRLPTRALLTRLFAVFDEAPRPFLLKCSGGQDRTSLAAALYLLDRDGWSAMEQAKAQFAGLPYLHFPNREQRWLQAFPEFAREASGGRPIGEWIRESYDPQVLAQWLYRWLGRGSFRGIYP